jgi:hypothetical protein
MDGWMDHGTLVGAGSHNLADSSDPQGLQIIFEMQSQGTSPKRAVKKICFFI